MRRSELRFFAVLLALASACGCGGSPELVGLDALGIGDADRERIFSQIVDTPAQPEESGLVEILPYTYLLRLTKLWMDEVRGSQEPGQWEERWPDYSYPVTSGASLREVMAAPDRFRGTVFKKTGIIKPFGFWPVPEASGLCEEGWSMIGSYTGYVQGGKLEIFETWFLIPPARKEHYLARLAKDPEAGYQAAVVSGRFFKVITRASSDDGGEFRLPVLICPPPCPISYRYDVDLDLRHTSWWRHLPLRRYGNLYALRREVVFLAPGGGGVWNDRPIDPEGLARRLAALRPLYLLDGEGYDLSVVFVCQGKVPEAELLSFLRAARAAGIQRLSVKRRKY